MITRLKCWRYGHEWRIAPGPAVLDTHAVAWRLLWCRFCRAARSIEVRAAADPGTRGEGDDRG